MEVVVFNVSTSLSVQSWCFRHFTTTPLLITQVQALGLRQIELCGVHADFNDESSFEKNIGQFRDAGIAITSIGVQTFKGDIETEEKWFRFCRMAGAKMIAADIDVASMPGGLQTASALAEKYQIPLGIHNHGGTHWLGNAQMLRNIFRHMGPQVGLCLDSAWCMQAGEEPFKWVEEFRERLYGVHVKDFVFDRAGRWNDVVVGQGNLKLREFIALATAAPQMEAITVEYEADVENPGPALRECVAQVRAATARIAT